MSSALYLAERIFGARKLRRIKQEALAAILGCTRSYISKLESSTVIPSADFALKLERALKLRRGTLGNIVETIRRNEASLKRQAIDHARGGNNHDHNGCVHCKKTRHNGRGGNHKLGGRHIRVGRPARTS